MLFADSWDPRKWVRQWRSASEGLAQWRAAQRRSTSEPVVKRLTLQQTRGQLVTIYQNILPHLWYSEIHVRSATLMRAHPAGLCPSRHPRSFRSEWICTAGGTKAETSTQANRLSLGYQLCSGGAGSRQASSKPGAQLRPAPHPDSVFWGDATSSRRCWGQS